MPKIFSLEEKRMVKDLAQQGFSQVEILTKMKERYPGSWGAKGAYKSIARILSEKETPKQISAPSKTLDEMSREERFRFIEEGLKTSPRYKIVFENFDNNYKELFINDYLEIVRSIDTLTEAENQALFSAILEKILAFQALSRKQREERYLEQSLEGIIQPNDPKFRTFVDDKYQKEYDQHIKLSQKWDEQLKQTRQQRLKEVRTERRTLIDLAEELSTKTAQADAATEIERLSKLRDDELKKMIDSGYLYGTFND